MKKILIYNKSLESGGAERQLLELAKLIRATDNEVCFLADNCKGQVYDELVDCGISVRPSYFTGGMWSKGRQLRSVMQQGHYDTIVTYLPECNMVSILAGFPSKSWRIVTGARSANPEFRKNIKLKLYYYLHLFSNVVITNSETNKNDIEYTVPLIKHDKIKVIYNFIRAPHAVLGRKNCSAAAYQRSIAVVANYRDVKNTMNVIEALKLLSSQERAKVKIDWFGSEVDSTLALAHKRSAEYGLTDVIELHKAVSDAYDVYANADWVGLFSKFEGLPNSLCEALILGKPVVTTPVSDMPLLLNGTGNVVCQGSDPESIAEGLRRVINISADEAAQIGKDNVTCFSKLFSREIIAAELLAAVL